MNDDGTDIFIGIAVGCCFTALVLLCHGIYSYLEYLAGV